MFTMGQMKFFTKSETKIIATIFIVLFIIIGFNMKISIRKGRDNTRKNDLSALQNALDTYLQKYKTYPLSSSNSEIIGCFSGGVQLDPISEKPTNAEVCKWGESKFEDSNFMPQDPSFKKGMSYYYVSDGDHYQIYISLEGKDEPEYTPSIALKNLHCGSKICNYGRSN